MSCAGRVALCESAPPSFDTEWSADGTLAHALLAKLFEAREMDAAAYIGQYVQYEGEGKEITMGLVKPETARAVQVAIDYVYGITEGHDDALIWIEHRVEVPSAVVPGRMWGTGDIFVYLPTTKTLHVLDYKHGVGIHVDEVDNEQLKFYALAMLFELNRPVDHIEIGVIQPRSFELKGAVRPIPVTIAELFEFHGKLEDAAVASLQPNAPFTPNASYCRWCPAATICKAYEEFSLTPFGAASFAELLYKPLKPLPNMPIDKLLAIKQAEPYLRGLLNAANDQMMGYARQGYDLPGWKLVPGKAQRAWHGDQQEIADNLAFVTGLEVDAFYPRQLIPLTEAEKLVVDAMRNGTPRQPGETKKAHAARANKAAELAHTYMANLTLKEPGRKISLAPITDPRPRIDATASNFEGIVIPQEDAT